MLGSNLRLDRPSRRSTLGDRNAAPRSSSSAPRTQEASALRSLPWSTPPPPILRTSAGSQSSCARDYRLGTVPLSSSPSASRVGETTPAGAVVLARTTSCDDTSGQTPHGICTSASCGSDSPSPPPTCALLHALAGSRGGESSMDCRIVQTSTASPTEPRGVDCLRLERPPPKKTAGDNVTGCS